MSLNKTNLKHLVEEIKKMAFVDHEDAPTSPAPVSQTMNRQNKVYTPNDFSSTPTQAPQGHSSVDPATAKSIRLMQQALQSVFDAANGNIDFTKYIMDHEKMPSYVNSLLNRKISMDGAWGKETSSFLNGAMYLALGIRGALSNFGGVAPNSKSAFRHEDYQQMQSLLPKSKNPMHDDPDGLAEKADALTKLLDKLTYFYQNYSKTVLENTTYKALTNKETPVLTIGKMPPDKFKPLLTDNNFLNQTVLSDVNLKNSANQDVNVREIRLVDLKNPKYFQNFLQGQLGYTQEQSENPTIQKNILDTILAQVSTTWKLSEKV